MSSGTRRSKGIFPLPSKRDVMRSLPLRVTNRSFCNPLITALELARHSKRHGLSWPSVSDCAGMGGAKTPSFSSRGRKRSSRDFEPYRGWTGLSKSWQFVVVSGLRQILPLRT